LSIRAKSANFVAAAFLMKHLFILICLLSFNFCRAQDQAVVKAFPKFLNSSTGNGMKSVVDENGMETILGIVSGSIYINGSVLTVTGNQLMIFRHFIGDSLNYKYAYISDPSKGSFSFSSFTDICNTSRGVGFIINFLSVSISLKYPVYTTPVYNYNSVFLEIDSQFNLVNYTKFGGFNSFSWTKLASDKNGNAYGILSSSAAIFQNESNPITITYGGSYSLVSFKGSTLNWNYSFTNSSGLTFLQLIESDHNLFLGYYISSKNAGYRNKPFNIKSFGTLGILKFDSSGNLVHEIETDTVTLTIYNYAFIYARGNRVFASFPYTSFIRVGNYQYEKSTTQYVSLFLEMDTALNLINPINLSSAVNYTLCNPKAYDPGSGLLYMDVFNLSSTSQIKPTVINDTFLYFNNFRHYYNLQEAHNLFCYNTNTKGFVSCYDFSVSANTLFNLFIPKAPQPFVYGSVLIYSNIKLEGKTLTDNNNRNFLFTLKKPVQMVKPPSRIKISRKPGNVADITWVNNDIYDSVQLEKYMVQSNTVAGNFTTNGSPSSYADNSNYFVAYNYFFKVRGFRGGEPSIWSASDSSATGEVLILSREIFTGILNDSDIGIFWSTEYTSINNIYTTSVYRSDYRDHGFIELCELPKGSKSYPDTSTIPNHQYYYFVTDHNSISRSSTDTIGAKIGGTIILGTKSYLVYPNPCGKILHFDEADKNNEEVTITNAIGQQTIYKLMEKDDHYDLDVSFLHPGIYIIGHNYKGVLYKTRIVKE
jgi:hypothetical protein